MKYIFIAVSALLLAACSVSSKDPLDRLSYSYVKICTDETESCLTHMNLVVTQFAGKPIVATVRYRGKYYESENRVVALRDGEGTVTRQAELGKFCDPKGCGRYFMLEFELPQRDFEVYKTVGHVALLDIGDRVESLYIPHTAFQAAGH
ncbi:hypothetical protein [Ferrimonas marina]|nr:hypothetical protein [Ferrimonas marina]